MWNLLLVICLSIPSFSDGQGIQFSNVEYQVNTLLEILRALKHLVYDEKTKHQPHAFNATNHATVDPMRNAFASDLERRIMEMKYKIDVLVINTKVCPKTNQVPFPPRNISVFTETIQNLSTIRVSWEPPEPEPPNLQYRVQFAPIAADGTQLTPVSFSICEKHHTVASITDIHPNTKFNIKVSSIAGPNHVKPSEGIIIKTFDEIPPSPSFLNAFGVTPNKVTLKWDRPQIMGTIIAYHLHAKNDLGDRFTQIIKPPVEQYVLSNLPEGTNHVFVVTAESDNGEGPGSPQVSVKTLDFQPPPPLNLQCTFIGHDMITLSWKKPPMYQGMGVTRGYNISIKDDMYNIINHYSTNDTSTTSTNITNLAADHVFYFTASSYTRRRQGPPGIIISCKTNPTIPSPPRNVQLFNHTFGPPSIRIIWEPSMYRNDKSVDYSVQWGVVGGATRVETIPGGRMEFISDYLDYGSDHHFKVTAKNTVGFSEPVTVYHTTPYRNVTTPENVTVERVPKDQKDSKLLSVSWDKPKGKIFGYRILHRKFEWVYTGRWNLETINTPHITSKNITVDDPKLSYIVVIRCIVDPPGTPYNPGPYIQNTEHPNYHHNPQQGQPQYHGQAYIPPNGPPYNPPPGPPQGGPPQVNYPNNAPQNVGNNQNAQGLPSFP